MTSIETAIHSFAFRALSLVVVSCGPAFAKDFSDWTVECDNVRTCSAFGFPAEAQERKGFIRLERAGGPQSPAEVSITIFVDGAVGSAPLSLKIDGKPIPGVASLRDGASGQAGRDGFTTRLSSDELGPFVAAIRRGVTLTLAGAKGEVAISLRGAVASLLNIDDVQGRIQTMTALVRKGDDRFVAVIPPEPDIVAVKPVQTIDADKSLAVKLRERLKSDLEERCGDVSADSEFTDEVFALDANHDLVGLVCSTGYNVTMDYWIVNTSDVANVMPVKFEAPGKAPGNGLVNAKFDKLTGAIDFSRKDGGAGACGASGRYVWTGEKFALASYTEMGPCRGVPPKDWPIIWRARVL
jgi:Protein of unknown function (DUF1176)